MRAIVDLQSIGRDHIPFNTAFLEICRRIWGDEPIGFVCRADHEQEMRPALSALNIDFIELPAHLHKPCPGRFTAYDERAHHAFIVDLCRRLPVDHLVLSGIRADLLERIRRKPPAASVDILFHATLAEPINWRSRNPVRRRFDMFGVLRQRFPANVRLIFLEEGVARSARPLLAKNTRAAVLPHPIPSSPANTERALDSGVVNVGFLGEQNPGRGFEHFIELARQRPGHLRLHCIGRRGAHYSEACDPLFDTPPSRSKLAQAEFDAAVGGCDLAFLPLDPRWYDLVASGTLLDCVRFAVPPVIVRNAVTDAIEEKYGRFGFVVDCPRHGIELLCRTAPETYLELLPQFRAVLNAIAIDRTVEAICRDFPFSSAQ